MGYFIPLLFRSKFFSPLEPVDIRIVYDKTDRPSGEAIVEFSSHEEAVEAMSKVLLYNTLMHLVGNM